MLKKKLICVFFLQFLDCQTKGLTQILIFFFFFFATHGFKGLGFMWLLQDGKHGKAWGIVHKEGECLVILLLNFPHLVFDIGIRFGITALAAVFVTLTS